MSEEELIGYFVDVYLLRPCALQALRARFPGIEKEPPAAEPPA
jgi:hypothetical protein